MLRYLISKIQNRNQFAVEWLGILNDACPHFSWDVEVMSNHGHIYAIVVGQSVTEDSVIAVIALKTDTQMH